MRKYLKYGLFIFVAFMVMIPLLLLILLYKDKHKEFKDVAITNLTGSGFTVTWISKEKEKGEVIVTKNGESFGILPGLFKKRFYDDRDIKQNDEGEWVLKDTGSQKRHTHHVTIRGLEPESEYEIMIVGKLTGIKFDDKNTESKEYLVKTTAINENLTTPDPAYGKILNLKDPSKSSKDGIVYIRLYNPGGLEVYSNLYSIYIGENYGYSVDLNNIRLENGEEFIRGDETILLLIAKTTDGEIKKRFLLQDYKPLPNIFIQKKVSLDNKTTRRLITEVDAIECPTMQCEAGGACYPDGWCCAHNTTDTSRPYGTYACRAGNWEYIAELPEGVEPFDSEVYKNQFGGNHSSCSIESCSETYTESCSKNIDGEVRLGTLICHKQGESPCGVSGPACSWGAGSYCEECQVDNENRDYNTQLLARIEQESANRQEYISDNNIFNIESLSDLMTTLNYIGLRSNICLDIDTTYIMGCTYKSNSVCYSIERGDDGFSCNSIELSCNDNIRNDQDSCKLESGEEQAEPEAESDPCAELPLGGDESRTPVLSDSSNSIRLRIGCQYCVATKLMEVGENEALEVNDSNIDCTKCNSEQYGISRCVVDESESDHDGGTTSNEGLYNVLGLVRAEGSSGGKDYLEVSEPGKYVIYAGDNFEQPLSEFTIDTGDGKAKIKLFVDENGNGKKDEGEPVIKDYAQLKLKKESEAVVWSLGEGWNLISIPMVSNEGITTASKLLDKFNAQGADVKHIARYTDKGFEIYTKREGDVEFSNDFYIVSGQGYFVLNYRKTNVSLTGNKFDDKVPFRTRNGWNLVGIYTNGEKRKSSDILKKMEAEGIVADIMSRYDSGRYESIVYENETLYGNDYNIVEKQGYFIRIKEGGGKKFTP